ncbi:hypothetical protein M413DRAFT_130574 [Hebeloma cylindrosporum]|uniref:Nephrocystin 3-like N-terminal domain-containing protein n=1 Tax=Hebeloma cylindrosporum TaxID=76867 RepID=A0A0C2XXB9_HEBCY|nr:hypothetical protein M413DRAFT_130574 [Hebeloma cylindrosporum h7]
MMVMHGPAGSGKSALAQSIAERCKLQGWSAAAFFFSRTAPGRNNGFSLFPTIIYQLLSSHPEVRPAVWIRLWRRPTLLKKSMEIITAELLIGPFLSWICIVLCWFTGSFLFSWTFGWIHPRLIVIDGLDECDDKQIQSRILTAAAMATTRLPRPFRILILCRPEQHILQTLQGLDHYVDFDLGQRNASQDIQLFLTDKFEKLSQTHPLAKYDRFPASWPGPDIIDQITTIASGQFIYASVVMAYLESDNHSPMERLSVILGLSAKPSRDAPFDALDALYLHILTSVEDDDDLLLRQILSLMVIPRTEGDNLGEYTSPTMMAAFISSVSTDTEGPRKSSKGVGTDFQVFSGVLDRVFLLLDQLRSLISSAGADDTVKFWHASISDFLLDKARSKHFFVHIPLVHEALARAYLRLFRGQGPQLFFGSSPDLFVSFLEHYKRAPLSKELTEDLLAYDFFAAYKAAIGSPSLAKVAVAWLSERVPKLFRTLVLHPQGQNIVDSYIYGLHRSYPLENWTKKALQRFLDSTDKASKWENNEKAANYALYVHVLHVLLNGDHTACATTVAAKSVTGILAVYDLLSQSSPMSRLPTLEKTPAFMVKNKDIGGRLKYHLSNIRSAFKDCSSILLSHTSHYSAKLVKLLLRQKGLASLLPMEEWMAPSDMVVDFVEPTVIGPYLEQFEDRADAPPELRMFLDKYHALIEASQVMKSVPSHNIIFK